jgi:7,8-dihydroneopterin aldolase/epimerase/oxygenase
MAVIALEGMRFYSFHGLYEEERIIGTHFILDLLIETDISQATVIEEHGVEKLTKTINYETVYDICQIEMSQPKKLLEDVIKSIVIALQFQFQTIHRVNIKIRKQNPPLGGRVDWSSVEMGETYVKQCGRCGKPLICYNNAACWCHDTKFKIHPRTMEMLNTQFKGCLCKNCLTEYAG